MKLLGLEKSEEPVKEKFDNKYQKIHLKVIDEK